MNEKDHNPDDRLEVMLRRWGADEASRQVNIPPMPEMLPQRRWRTILLRWGPPAAAAAMLLVAVGLFLAGRSDNTAVAPTQENAKSLKAELARTKDELVKAKNELTTAKNDYELELAQLGRKITELLRDAAGVSAEIQKTVSKNTDLQQQVALVEARLEEEKSLLKETLSKLDQARKQQTAEKKHLDELIEQNKKIQVRLAAAVSELDRVGKKYQQTFTDSQKAQSELAALKARHKVMSADFQRAYLAAAAGMEHAGRRIDLAVRQSAARNARLPARCAEIRASVQSPATGKVMDRLEVVLTRLNLLDPANPAEAETFAALIRRGNLVKEIDAVLAEGRERPVVRAWLLEAGLILAGAEHVG